ncbi:MAG: L-histidine N(alpha)-methyltransferase [Myxococcota bacterium]
MTSNRSAAARVMPLHDLHPEPDDVFAEVVAGLSAERKTLPCKLFYDERGSRLFDRICELEEYYPTRTEISILETRAAEIAGAIGERALVVELGSGSSMKTEILLDALACPAGYVPIDIARDHLTAAARRVAARFPGLPVWPVCADFNAPIELPTIRLEVGRRLIFFPGSTIGNFDVEGRLALLGRMHGLCETSQDRLLIGIDLIKDVKRLECAYDDAEGVTAAFNRNLLRRINRELGADFEVESFAHRARFDPRASRVEMHLVSERDQTVRIDGRRFRFTAGETICTEHSYKFTVPGFSALATRAGWRLERTWTDPEGLFAILLLAA